MKKRAKALAGNLLAICFFPPVVVFAEAELFNDEARPSELASP